ncbi:MAG: GAF domain-containing protein [Anaerolineaceae bacterium]|nr:GAF domain-containing protein [Anaerolineae bacterium]MCB9450290.1 GAF domain-containing protein [Anaerolineaceae bacterium]
MATESIKQDMIRLCHSALDSRSLRVELLKRLQTVIAFDYVYFSTTDPATQLMTSSIMPETPPSWLMPVFLENEFLQEDYNKFSDMLRTHQVVGILSQATDYEPFRSQRYRDMLMPMAIEDELRAIFVTEGACWGTLCLHRERSKVRYTPAEADFMTQLAPHIADGLRKALLLDSLPQGNPPDGPGVLILADDLSVVAMTAAAEYWLTELAETQNSARYDLPITVRSVVAGLKAIESGMATSATPKIRLHTRSGHWLMLCASRLTTAESQAQITVIFEVAQPTELAPLMMQAYLLTKREGEIIQCVLRGWSTNEIATRLHISANTVQDHLKAIFEKVDVRSRGELAARIFTQQYQR